MTKAGERTLVEDLLVSNLDDWAYASWVVPDLFARAGGTPELVRAATFGLIAELILQGLVSAGDIIDGVHVAWNCTPAAALERIVLEWISEWGYEIPNPGAIVWLASTPKGTSIAQAVLAREAEAT